MRSFLLLFIGLSIICLAGCGGSGGDQTNLCADPAPVLGTYDPDTPQYIIMLNEEVDHAAEANRLADVYGFELMYVYEYIPGFVAMFSTDVLEQMRCEPSIISIQHDQTVYPN